MPGKRKLYWDSCIFLAWLQNEACEPGVMEGIEEAVRQVHDNEAVLFTSIVTQSEVLEGTLSKEAQEKFDNLFKRKNVVWVNHDTRVGKLSHDIRNYYNERDIKIEVPDSVHLASAILYEADELQTLDGSGKRKRKSDLLSLNGKVAGKYKLTIKQPYAKQMSLLAQIPREEKKAKKENEKNKTN